MTPWSSGKWRENRVPPLLTNKFIFHWMYDCLGLLFFKANLFSFFSGFDDAQRELIILSLGAPLEGASVVVGCWSTYDFDGTYYTLKAVESFLSKIPELGRTHDYSWFFPAIFRGVIIQSWQTLLGNAKDRFTRDWILKGTKHIRTETTNDIWYYQ